MANRVTIEIGADGTAFVVGSKKVDGAMGKMEGGAKRLGKTFKTALKVGAVAATAAIAALTYAIYRAVKAANVQEDAERSLTDAIGYRSQALLDQASALQQVTRYGDEQIIVAQALIGSFVKDESQIKAATKATLDLAAAKKMDLTAAADLISKTLGSSTNAMSRYGIQVEGAVGSTERLESLTKSIADVFGGQAAGQAKTFGGRIQQLINVHGDLWEEMGFVVTQNTFFIKGIDLAKQYVQRLSEKVKENRLYLMELTRDGILTVVSGIGKAIEVMRFFHNGWLGIKLVSNATAIVMADTLQVVFEGLRLVLKPLDLIFQGLVKLGRIKVNPFDKMEEAIGTFQLSTRDVLRDTIKEIESTNIAYDKTKGVIDGIEEKLKEIEVTQSSIKEAASASPAASELPELTEAELKARQKARADLAQLEQQSPYAYGAEGTEGMSEIERIQFEYAQKMEALQGYNTQVIQEMINAGESQAAIEQRYADLKMQYTAKERDFKIAAAGQTLGALSNLMQNLYVITGSKNKTLFKAMKTFAIAKALIGAYTGAAKTYAEVPFPYNFVAAASVLAAGIAQVQKIRSTEPGGASGTISAGGTATPSYSGGSPSAYPVPQRVKEKEEKEERQLVVNYHIYGDLLNDHDELARKMVGSLTKAMGDNAH